MNWDKVYTLLHIAERTAQWPALSKLHQAAMKELGGHMEELEEPTAESPAQPPTRSRFALPPDTAEAQDE